MNTQIGLDIHFFQVSWPNYEEFAHLFIHYKKKFLSFGWKGGGSGARFEINILDSDPGDQMMIRKTDFSLTDGILAGAADETLLMPLPRLVLHFLHALLVKQDIIQSDRFTFKILLGKHRKWNKQCTRYIKEALIARSVIFSSTHCKKVGVHPYAWVDDAD